MTQADVSARHDALKRDARALYDADYSIAKISEMLGTSRAHIHRLIHEDGDSRVRNWAPAEDAILRAAYNQREKPDCSALAKTLKRTANAVQQRADHLGITNAAASPSAVARERSSATQRLQYSFGREHPRGMLGKNHTAEACEEMSRSRSGKTRPPRTAEWSRRIGVATAKRVAENPESVYSRCRGGRRADLENRFFRSSWEANIARWLNVQKIRWEYEPHEFEFVKVKRGARFYIPDFFLPDENRYIEVKGWMDPKSRTKLKRMVKYFPLISIELIDAARYAQIARSCAGAIPGWE